MSSSRQRVYASLVGFGICIMQFHTFVMLTDGSLAVLVAWVSALLVAEYASDMMTLLGSLRWWMTTAERHAWLPLQAAAAAIILHAVRVLVFVAGRTGPWIDFDVRPEHRVLDSERWRWASVYFAAVLPYLGATGSQLWRLRASVRPVVFESHGSAHYQYSTQTGPWVIRGFFGEAVSVTCLRGGRRGRFEPP